MGVAQTLADVAAAYLLNAQAREEVRATADRFHHIALHDPLTGLPNRLLLQQRLEHAALRARRSNTNAAILFADLDRFKQVNDTYGHQVGDELLLAVAHRLTGLVRPGDTLARVSGDEFVFLCEDLQQRGRRRDPRPAHRPTRSPSPFVLDETELHDHRPASGMAFAGPGEEISDQLVDEADTAMYQAKRKGGAGHQIIDLREARPGRRPQQPRARPARRVRRRTARRRLPTDRAQLRRARHRRRGAAALEPPRARRGPTDGDGRRSPSRASLISEIGAWVLERSCRDRGRWLKSIPDAPLDLAVNVSTRQLMEPGLLRDRHQRARRTGHGPDARSSSR